MNKIAQVNIGQYFGSPYGTTLGLKDLVSIILSNAVAIAGVMLFAVFLVGGLTMITSAGDKEGVAKGQKIITIGIVGFLIVFVAYWIIVAIESIFAINILH